MGQIGLQVCILDSMLRMLWLPVINKWQSEAADSQIMMYNCNRSRVFSPSSSSSSSSSSFFCLPVQLSRRPNAASVEFFASMDTPEESGWPPAQICRTLSACFIPPPLVQQWGPCWLALLQQVSSFDVSKMTVTKLATVWFLALLRFSWSDCWCLSRRRVICAHMQVQHFGAAVPIF